jgi:hypothetical protein
MSDLTRDILLANERLPHREHQLVGVKTLLEHRYLLLADEVGCGKSKQVVDTAQILFDRKEIDTVLVITPGFARSTWAEEDEALGEVAKHAWKRVPNVIHEYHKHYTNLQWDATALNWVVSNYEFIRRDDRLHELMHHLRGRRTFLVLDESWAIKGFSDQMKACRMLRVKRADRVVELNGTPLADGKPQDLYYPMMILSPDILDVKNRTHFKSKYCIMGGFQNKQVISYQNLDDLNQRIAPHVLSRRTRECWDLPKMLEPVTIEARMSPDEWKIYKDMRDDMVASVGQSASTASQAIVKALRLAQITSGFLGGLEELTLDDWCAPVGPGRVLPTNAPIPQWLRKAEDIHEDSPIRQEAPAPNATTPARPEQRGPLTREIGRAKLDAFLHWLDTREPQPHKLLVWSRFTPELERTTQALARVYPHVFQLRGGQAKDDRAAAKRFLAPGGDARSGACVGNQKAGGASLNFAAANIAVYLSNSPALIERTQSVGRIERPGATQPMLIVDVLACGPKGQKTIDHAILKALRGKDDMAQWTVQQWRDLLAQLKAA